jgi:hypothetical protein
MCLYLIGKLIAISKRLKRCMSSRINSSSDESM